MKKKPKQSNPNIVLVEEYSMSQEIAELQLAKLRDKARDGLLTYEEVKIFDLLTKNLYLAKGEATSIIENPSQERLSAPEAMDLLKIAQEIPSMQDIEVSEVLNIVEEAKDGESKDPNSHN